MLQVIFHFLIATVSAHPDIALTAVLGFISNEVLAHASWIKSNSIIQLVVNIVKTIHGYATSPKGVEILKRLAELEAQVNAIPVGTNTTKPAEPPAA